MTKVEREAIARPAPHDVVQAGVHVVGDRGAVRRGNLKLGAGPQPQRAVVRLGLRAEQAKDVARERRVARTALTDRVVVVERAAALLRQRRDRREIRERGGAVPAAEREDVHDNGGERGSRARVRVEVDPRLTEGVRRFGSLLVVRGVEIGGALAVYLVVQSPVAEVG